MRRPSMLVMQTAVAVLATGCGRLGFDSSGASRDAASTELRDARPPGDAGTGGGADAAGCAFGPWSAAVALTAVNSNSSDQSPALATDGLTLLFESDRVGGGNENIYEATRATTADPFGAPTELTALSGADYDGDPTFSDDGLAAYFSSNRSGAFRLYRSGRATATMPFGAPVEVGALAGDFVDGADLSADGVELVYSTASPTQLMRATTDAAGAFVIDGPITELDQTYDGFPSLSADRLTIYFETLRGSTDYDIYTATRSSVTAPFATPVRVSVSTAGNDGDPEISKDDRTLLFASDIAGSPDIYMATRSCL